MAVPGQLGARMPILLGALRVAWRVQLLTPRQPAHSGTSGLRSRAQLTDSPLGESHVGGKRRMITFDDTQSKVHFSEKANRLLDEIVNCPLIDLCRSGDATSCSKIVSTQGNGAKYQPPEPWSGLIESRSDSLPQFKSVYR